MESCPECGSERLSRGNKGLICDECGAVIEESIYSGERMIA